MQELAGSWLLGASVEGAVERAGQHLDEGMVWVSVAQCLLTMRDKPRKLESVITGIASASVEQNTGIGQINTTLRQMDGTTKQMAATVEEGAAAAEELSAQAAELGGLGLALQRIMRRGEVNNSPKAAESV